MKSYKTVLRIDDIDKNFKVNGAEFSALDHIDFHVEKGELVSIVGRSGCGKSTLLKLIAGFMLPDSGHISIEGRGVTRPGPDRCVVFQEDALFPWLNVEENIRFSLPFSKVKKKEAENRVTQFLDLVGLSDFRKFYPDEISGGMKQRVALARVFVLHPKVLLMDEPFAALDAQTRENMQDLLLTLWDQFRHTIVFVTHDIREAVTLSDRIIIMENSPGRLKEQVRVDLPRPRNPDSHEFLEYQKYVHAILKK